MTNQEVRKGEPLVHLRKLHQLPGDIVRIIQYATLVNKTVLAQGLRGPIADLQAEDKSGALMRAREKIVNPIVFIPYEAVRIVRRLRD